MNILNEIYRQFLTKGHFGPEARLVYQGEGGTEYADAEKETGTEATEKEGQPEAETPEPLSHDHFTNKKEEYENHVKSLKDAYEKTTGDEKENITEGETLIDLGEQMLDLDEKYNENLTDLEDESTDNAKKLADEEHGELNTELNKYDQELNKLIQAAKGHLRAANVEVEEPTAETPHAKETTETTEITPEMRTQLASQLFNTPGFKDAIAPMLGKGDLGSMSLTEFEGAMQKSDLKDVFNSFLEDPKIIEALEAGELSNKQLATLANAVFDKYGIGKGLEAFDKAEFDLIQGFEITVAGQKKTMKEVFGAHGLAGLSMSHEITAGEGIITLGKITIKSGDEFPADLLSKFTPKTKEQYEAILKFEEGTDPTKALEGLQASATKDHGDMENLHNMKQILENPETAEALKGGGGKEMLLALFKALPILKEAWEAMDLRTIGDFAKDLKNPRAIGPKIEKATAKYENALKDTTNINDLLALYHEPYGGKATELVGEDTPYRIIMRNPVKKQLAKKLGVGAITNIEGDINLTRVTASEAGKKVVVEIKDGIARHYKVATDKEGKEEWNEDADRRIATTEEAEQRLKTEEKAPEEPKELAGVNPDLVGEGNVVKELGENRIHNVLKYNEVESAVITIGKEGGERAGQNIPEGTEVTVKQGSVPGYAETFQIAEIKMPEGKEANKELIGKRFYVYQGDKILNTTKAEKEEKPV